MVEQAQAAKAATARPEWRRRDFVSPRVQRLLICSRETATLEERMTCTSMPWPHSHHANQKPSRPAS